MRRILFPALLLCLLLSLGKLTALKTAQHREQTEFAALAEETAPVVSSATPEAKPATRFELLAERNPDYFAWLTVEGTRINYPVMHSPTEPDRYLHRNFDGGESLSGTPYLAADCGPDSDNLLIYGHNMRDGTMFADLLRYQEAEFWRQHPTLTLETAEGVQSFEIVAAFRERVHFQSESGVFRYYAYAGALTEAEFADYAAQIAACALYQTGCSPVYGRQLVTLSTCAYHTENGRFVLVAQKMLPEPEELREHFFGFCVKERITDRGAPSPERDGRPRPDNSSGLPDRR